MISKFVYTCFGSFDPTEQSVAHSGTAYNGFGQIGLELPKFLSFLIPHVDYLIIAHHHYRLLVVFVKETTDLHAFAQCKRDFHRQL